MITPTAEQLFYQALAKQQDNALADAEALYRKALQLAPARPSILLNLAVVLVGLRRHEEAEKIAVRLLQADPHDEESLVLLGACQSNLGRKHDALATFERVLKVNPLLVDAWNDRGNVLLDLQKPDAALDSYDHALRLAPDHADALNNRGNALLELGRGGDALDSYNKALQERQNFALAYNNRGNALLSLNQTCSAMKSFNAATQIQPDYARAHWNESLCRLSLGDFAAGWEQYDWGWIDGQRGPKLNLGRPWWDGRAVDGNLLVWGEQGIGDQILFSGMLPELARYGKSVTAAVDPRLVTLFQRSFPSLKIVSKDGALHNLPFDAHVALGNIGQHLRKSWSDFPANRSAYLFPDTTRARHLRERLMAKKIICGISWISKNNVYAAQKSIRLPDLQPILALENFQFVDLQYGDTAGERERLDYGHALHVTHLDDIDNFNDIDGLAALIGACDVVLTVSNTTAHLAGALGKPTLLLLPHSVGRHWYWHEGSNTSPWYPSVSIFRQSTIGDWESVIAQAKAMLVDRQPLG